MRRIEASTSSHFIPIDLLSTNELCGRLGLQRPVSVIEETPRGGGLDLFHIFPLFCIFILLNSSDVEKRLHETLVSQMIFIRKISILENDCITAW
jgi:hypothetical protein